MRGLNHVARPLVSGAALLFLSLATGGCAAGQPVEGVERVPVSRVRPMPAAPGVMLGIDVLEQQGFRVLMGKRVGLLTHPAGVNRFGLSTVEVLRRDRRLNLVALFAVEHGIHGEIPAGEKYDDHVDARTGLPVYSLFSGRTRSATPEQLRGIDVMVIDLQDIGTRSYTFTSAMLYQLKACFQNGVEVVVLDRPNPLGGEKVSGPMMDPEWLGYLGAFPVPYVHGLTMGELARMAVSTPGMIRDASGVLEDDLRKKGRLTVVPMRGWRRSMTWEHTGLRWTGTSPYVQTLDAVYGYPMTGLGAQIGGFQHGIGTPFPFRLLSHPSIPPARLKAELDALRLPGLAFRLREVVLPPSGGGRGAQPRKIQGVYVEITDWNTCRPTDLSFHMMQIAARAASRNPFAAATEDNASLYNKHVGSTAWWRAIRRDGAHVDVNTFLREWDERARVFQRSSRRHWFYQ